MRSGIQFNSTLSSGAQNIVDIFRRDENEKLLNWIIFNAIYSPNIFATQCVSQLSPIGDGYEVGNDNRKYVRGKMKKKRS